MVYQSALGRLLVERRTQLRLTQIQVVRRTGIQQRTISAIERGRVKLPGAVYRRSIAQVYGLSQVDLLIAAGEVTEEELQAWLRVHQPIPRPSCAARPEEV